MSNKKQESLADIVADMRQGMNPNGTAECQYLESDICTLADRIEAAAKRDAAIHAMTCEANERLREHLEIAIENNKRTEVGNATAMREALEIAEKAICHHAEHICDSLAWENSTINANCGDILCAHRDLCKAKTAILRALAAPARNCDVGTAEEQDERFKKFCLSYYEPCNVDGECWKCPLFKTKTRCPIAWAQMPHEKGERSE